MISRIQRLTQSPTNETHKCLIVTHTTFNQILSWISLVETFERANSYQAASRICNDVYCDSVFVILEFLVTHVLEYEDYYILGSHEVYYVEMYFGGL
jgi:DNA relaxase NicK